MSGPDQHGVEGAFAGDVGGFRLDAEFRLAASGITALSGPSGSGKTEVISVRIYQQVEALQYAEAHRLAAGVVAFSFAALLAMLLIDRSPLGGSERGAP